MVPLTIKGEKILKQMTTYYTKKEGSTTKGKKKAEKVFNAMITEKKLTGVESKGKKK